MPSPTEPIICTDSVPRADPTRNITDLVDAVVSRLDDLRDVENRATRKITHSEIRDIRRMANLRAQHLRELRKAEAGRIDAILVNVADTAKLTSAAAEIRATTLANQVTTSADTLRNQVADAAQASNDTLDRRFDPIQKSIEEIRRFQFETQGGKAGLVETRAAEADLRPIMDAIAELTKAQSAAVGAKAQVAEHQAVSTQTLALAAILAVLGSGLLSALVTVLIRVFGG